MTLTPHYQDEAVTLYAGDCLDILRKLPAESVDSVCTDPPYGLEFMGKDWDSFKDSHGNPLRSKEDSRASRMGLERGGADPYIGSGIRFAAGVPFQAWCESWAAECLRIVKPGGYMLAFGGTRTSHRLACAVEDAGFEIRDSIAWLYGSGFPKSLNVERSVDTFLCVLPGRHRWTTQACTLPGDHVCPSTAEGRAHAGDGTALKPSFEPIVMGRKPLVGTVAANVLAHGTGALNVGGCRVGNEPLPAQTAGQATIGTFERGVMVTPERIGRWPTNVILDDTQAAELDRQSGDLPSQATRADATKGSARTDSHLGALHEFPHGSGYLGESGGASRFFPTFRYEAKAPTSERPRDGEVAHPTVKPLDLMRWLVRLVTPPGGVVLDPFAGSGTTAEACIVEGFRCIAIEREADYLPLIVARLSKPIAPVFDFGASA